MNALDKYRDKWREVPAGDDTDGRLYSSDLMKETDEAFLARWQDMADRRAAGAMSWFRPLYRDFFKDRRILEIGPGAGVDGMPMAELGAKWTFADIVPENLANLRRLAALKGVEAGFHQIGEDLSFDGLEPGFDAILVVGSIHHVPYEMTRREAMNALTLLRQGGRWIELVYPPDRWQREGRMPFDSWGRRTDGERTPWVEWYDMEKIRRRLRPGRFRTVLDFPLRSGDQQWVDLEYLGMGRESLGFVDLHGDVRLQAGGRDSWTFEGPRGAFHPIAHILLEGRLGNLAAPYEFEVTLRIEQGAVGIGLADASGSHLPDTEIVARAAPDPVTITLRTGETPAELVIRNRHEDRESRFTLLRAIVREAP